MPEPSLGKHFDLFLTHGFTRPNSPGWYGSVTRSVPKHFLYVHQCCAYIRTHSLTYFKDSMLSENFGLTRFAKERSQEKRKAD